MKSLRPAPLLNFIVRPFEVVLMIEATQKKLREARFFLSHLETENRRAVRNEPEAFDYFMSAFVSAARSVTFALQAEEKTILAAALQAYVQKKRDIVMNNQVSLQRDLDQKGFKYSAAVDVSEGELEAMRLVAKYDKKGKDDAQARADEVNRLIKEIKGK